MSKIKLLKFSTRKVSHSYEKIKLSFVTKSIDENFVNYTLPYVLRNFMMINVEEFKKIIEDDFKYRWNDKDLKKAIASYNKKQKEKSFMAELDKNNNIESVFLPPNIEGN